MSGENHAEKKLLETCVDSVESALAAQTGGADRIELCSALVAGGLSPSHALLEAVRKRVSIPVRAMVRPRAGDFLYSEFEKEIMLREAALYAQSGAEGIVCGALTPDGALDCVFLRAVRAAAPGAGYTLHRAFDLSADPFAALEEAIDIGFDTILTSGQRASCIEGAALLRELRERAAGRIAILAGAGIDARAISAIHAATGVRQYHMSGKRTVESAMAFRREGVPMGLPGMSEYEKWETDSAKIKLAAETLAAIN